MNKQTKELLYVKLSPMTLLICSNKMRYVLASGTILNPPFCASNRPNEQWLGNKHELGSQDISSPLETSFSLLFPISSVSKGGVVPDPSAIS